MDGNLPPPLSARFKESFAYPTIKERLPSILAKIADTTFRNKSEIKEQYGEDGCEDLKSIAGCISKLRNEIMTGKILIPIQDKRTDVKTWNDYLDEMNEREGSTPQWFISPWLYVECYMYRRVQEAVENCSVLNQYDVFMEQKRQSLIDSDEPTLILMNYLFTVTNDLQSGKSLDIETLFKQLIQVSLWGNKCDLSISGGADNAQKSCPLDQVNTLRDYILRDDLDSIWQHIRDKAPCRIDIILDNAGFELVTDLCLAEFLTTANLASQIYFHAKAFPWFVSDVTKTDFDFTFQRFMQSNSMAMSKFVNQWKNRLDSETWNFVVNDFWTSPFPYCEMKKYSPELYSELSKSSLLIFKGDLNYRKLVGDRSWSPSTDFDTSLQGFCPAPLCTLRTLKADVVTGLSEGKAENIEKQDKDWMINGQWAVIEFSDGIKK